MRVVAATLFLLTGCFGPPPDLERELVEAVAEHRLRFDAALDSQEAFRVEVETEALGRLAQANFVSLLAALASADPAHQEAAAFALGFSRNRAAAVPLAEATESERPALRAFAVAALGMLGCRDVPLEPFRKRLGDGAWQVRHAALFGLRTLASPATPAWLVEAVQGCLADSVMDVRNEAVLVLGRAGGAASVDAIASRSLKDPEALVRQNAARALGAIGKPAGKATPALIESLRDEDTRVVDAAWTSLRWIHGVDLDRSFESWRDWYEAARNR